MTCLSLVYLPSFLRWQPNSSNSYSLSLVQLQALQVQNRRVFSALSDNKFEDSLAQVPLNGGETVSKRTYRSKKGSDQSIKKVTSQILEDNDELSNDSGFNKAENVAQPTFIVEESTKTKKGNQRKARSSTGRAVEEKSGKGRKRRVSKKQVDGIYHQSIAKEEGDHEDNAFAENSEGKSCDALGIQKEERIKKVVGKQRKAKKMISDLDAPGIQKEEKIEKVRKPRTAKKVSDNTQGINNKEKLKRGRMQKMGRKKISDTMGNVGIASEHTNHGGFAFTANVGDDSEDDIELGNVDGEDISYTYGWPPLVCCFGAARHAFMPSGRPAHRLIDHEIHERMKDAVWSPNRFVRAPGGCAGSVALALEHLGGKVALMGKLGNDDFGQAMLYYLNAHDVQTRAVRIDNKRMTAVSRMKIGRHGCLKMTCIEPCAEDSLLKSEINIDVLKEAKMFYFDTSSLMDRNMRLTTLNAIKISKKLGGVIFYDLNLPLPLWQLSRDETKVFIQKAWNLADLIEVTTQELEFLCGIKAFENFGTKNNDKSKFIHYEPDMVAPLWHENLKVLFVTNGTSEIHYYTAKHDSSVLGTEDVPITPFTADMSASGDAIVAALMRMLSVQPHLITDANYLEHSIKYAINSGFIGQWLLARSLGYPPKDGTEDSVAPDLDGIRTITEKEFRTIGPD